MQKSSKFYKKADLITHNSNGGSDTMMKRNIIVAVLLILVLVIAAGCGNKSSDTVADIQESDASSGYGQEPASGGGSGGLVDKGGTDKNQPSGQDDSGPDTPVSSGPLTGFSIEEPKENALVKSGEELAIKGEANIPGAEFYIEVEDGHDILGKTTVKLDGDGGSPERFVTSVKLSQHSSPSGMVIFYINTPEGQREEILLLPIKFE